jgi:hypothetical protein
MEKMILIFEIYMEGLVNRIRSSMYFLKKNNVLWTDFLPWCLSLDKGWLENTISIERFWILKSAQNVYSIQCPSRFLPGFIRITIFFDF